MTAFPTPDFGSIAPLTTLPRKVRAIAVDSAVAENRRNTLPADAEKRATPRLSIAELNASSLDDIRQRWAKTRVDDRGPMTRFLDLLDLPRNTIASILAPSIEARKRAEGEIGTFGRGTVRTADILDDLGVENRIIRGVAGFVGDVALDPLTYVGPAGWGAKLTGTARAAKGLGATAQIGKRGLKVLRSAIENPAAATGDIGEWLRLSGATTRDAAHAAVGGNLRAKGTDKLWRFLGDDISQGGSKLVDDAMMVLPENAPPELVARVQAAKRYLSTHGRANQPGVRVGRDAAGKMGVEFGGPGAIKAGTQWAHIPFTDYALSGPALSGAARTGLRNERVFQNLAVNANDMRAVNEIQSQLSPIIDRLEEINNRADSHAVNLHEAEKARVAAQGRLAAGDVTAADELANIDTMLTPGVPDGEPTIADLFAGVHGEAKAAADDLTKLLGDLQIGVRGDLSEAAQLYLAQHVVPAMRAKASEAAVRFKIANMDTSFAKDIYANGIKDGGQNTVSMKKYIEDRVSQSVNQQKGVHDAAEAAKVAAHPEVPFTKGELSTEIGAKDLGTSGSGMRGSTTEYLAVDPADSTSKFAKENPAKTIRFTDPTARTPELDAAELAVHPAGGRPESDRRYLLGLVNKEHEGLGRIAGLDPGLLNIGDQWMIGSHRVEMIGHDASGVHLRVTPPETKKMLGGVEVVDVPPSRYYTLPADKPLPADPGSWAPPGQMPTPKPRPVPFNTTAAEAETAAKEWTAYRTKIQDDWYKTVSEMTEEGINARAKHADILNELARAHEEWAASVNAPIIQAMKTDDLVRRDIAALAVGANPEELGGNPLASMAAVAEALGRKTKNANMRDVLDKITSGIGHTFGNKSPSTAHDIARAIGSANDMKSELVTKITTEIGNDVRKIAADHGVRPSDVDSLMTVLVHAKSGEMPVAGDPLFDDIQHLVKNGIINPLDPDKKELYEAVKAAADRAKANIDELARIEIEAGRLSGTMRENYGLSNVMDPEARAIIRSQKSNKLLGDGQKAAKAAEEYFTKHRGTIEHEVMVNGKPVKFTDGDRVYSEVSPRTLDEMAKDPKYRETVASIREKLSAIDAYDNMAPGTQPIGRAMSPVEINRRAMAGEYSSLTGGRNMPIMVESAAVSAGYRFFAAERAKLAQQAMEFVKPHILPINSVTLKGVSRSPNKSTGFRTHNGLEGHIFTDRADRINIRIGDTVYRAPKLESEVPNMWNPAQALGNTDLQGYLPDRLATMVENLVNIGNSEKDLLGVVKLIETTTKLWKASTLLHPSWTLNDTIGNLIFMLTMGIKPEEIAKNLRGAWKVAWANNNAAEKLPEIMVDLRGSKVPASEIIRSGVQKTGNPAEAAMQVMGNQIYDVGGNIKIRGAKDVKELWDVRTKQAIMREQGQMAAKRPWLRKAEVGAKMLLEDGVRDRIWAPWLKMNGVANDWMRTTAYMALLERGMDPTSAARAVMEGMLDMGDLTASEKVFRKFIPFYQWTKNSGIYAVKQLFQNPKFYTLAPHAKRAIEETIDGEDRIPEHMRPQWMRDAMAVQFGTNPDSRKMLLLQQALPNEAGAYMSLLAGSPVLGQEAMADALGYFGNMLTPLLKAPLEVGTKREWFSGRTIGPEGDVTAGEHLMGQIRLAKEFGVGTGVRSGGLGQAYKTGGIPAAVARAVIGGRIQPADERRLTTGLQRSAQEKETGLRRRIALAEREGDKDASLKARVLLLRHYQQMEQKGLKIPKWAEKQVADVSSE